MRVEGAGAIVSGGASGLGEATVRALHERGAHVIIADTNAERGAALAAELGERASFVSCDVTDEAQVQAAVDAAGELRLSFACAGIGWATRTVHPRHGPHPLMPFETVVRVNLIGTFNLLRLAGTAIARSEPLADGARGVHVSTASVFDTPLLAALPEPQRRALGETIPFPTRLGRPEEYAALALHIVENPMLNGETIRLDGALRMAPR